MITRTDISLAWDILHLLDPRTWATTEELRRQLWDKWAIRTSPNRLKKIVTQMARFNLIESCPGKGARSLGKTIFVADILKCLGCTLKYSTNHPGGRLYGQIDDWAYTTGVKR